MKFGDINWRYTEIAAEYIGNGYKINAATMSGHQGEIAKVDLTDGNEIIRVMVDSFHDYSENTEGVEIVVGKSTDPVKPDSVSTWETVWSSHLEVLYRERYYKIGEDRKSGTEYGTKEEAEKAKALRYERYKRKKIGKDWSKDISDKALPIARAIIRREFGFKRISDSDIKVTKQDNRYIVEYREKCYRLH